MEYIELFAGIGGFRYGLENCNRWITKTSESEKGQEQSRTNRGNGQRWRTNSFACVYANEWDKYACQIYRKNFGNKELYEGDITKVSAESIPNFDLLVGGFPCQRFSIAGKRKGMSEEDTSGFEFFEVYRIAKVRRPKLLLLENVPGLFSSRGGKDFHTILKSLDEIGYDVEWDCINTSAFLPQNRLRVFIVGHLRGTGGQKVFPIGENDEIFNGEDKSKEGRTQAEISTTLRGSEMKADHTYIKEQIAIDKVRDGCLKAIREATLSYIQNPKLISYKKQNIAGSLISSQYKEPQIVNGIRRLTPTECERLQGFPDGWTEGISDTQRYKCLGNAVTTNVITEIGKKIILVEV